VGEEAEARVGETAVVALYISATAAVCHGDWILPTWRTTVRLGFRRGPQRLTLSAVTHDSGGIILINFKTDV
jgi:hypothetical protein